MSNEIERDVWKQHDHRLNEHDKEHAEFSRSFQQIEDQIKYMIGRLDNGLSPSVNDVRRENSEIKIAIANLDHRVEITQMKQNEKLEASIDAMKKRIDPIESKQDKMQNIYVWSIVSGVIMGMVALGITKFGAKIFNKQEEPMVGYKSLASKK